MAGVDDVCCWRRKGDQRSRPINLTSLPEAGLRTYLLDNFQFLICLALTGTVSPSALRPPGSPLSHVVQSSQGLPIYL